MLDKLAGLPTQIRSLERRLKDMDASKVSPAKIKEVTDTIKNLKELLKEKQEKREQRKKDKEQKAAETSKEEVKVESTVETEASSDKEAISTCSLCGGISFPTYQAYKSHQEEKHGHPKQKEYTPMDPEKKKEVVKRVEETFPLVSEKKEESLKKFSIDDKVEPVRGGNGSWGHVMREPDTNGDPLCYVKWMEGDLKDSHGMGGYYPNDLKKKAEGNPPPPDTSIVPEKYPCPCWSDDSAYCPKCKSKKTSDLKSNYDALLKDLKEEREAHYNQGNHKWVARLDQKIQDLEQKIHEKFNNEKESVKEIDYCKCGHPTTWHNPLGKCNDCDCKNIEKEGAQFDHHGSDLYILPNSPEETKQIINFLNRENSGFRWSSSNVEGQSWFGKRFIEVPFGEYLEPMMRNYFKNTPLKTKNVEEIMSKKEAGAQNATDLTIMDHTPPRANKTMDEGGKDGDDEFQDLWAGPAGTEKESAKGVPNSLFDINTAPQVVEQLKSSLNAPYVNAQVSTLGGDENVAIMLVISTDPREKWVNGILQNSRYGNFSIHNDGEVEQFSGGFSGFKQPNNFLRKTNVKTPQQLIDVLNAFLAKVNATSKVSSLKKESDNIQDAINWLTEDDAWKVKVKDNKIGVQYAGEGWEWYNPLDFLLFVNRARKSSRASLNKKASISIDVFNKNWTVTPVNKEGKLSYEISDNSGKKVLSISPLNGKEMNSEHLKWAIQREITRGFKQATLLSDVSFLKKGSKVFILAIDKTKGRVKFADLSRGVRGWISASKIKITALESQAVQHNGHSDKVLGASGTETLLDCTESGPIWVNSTELLDNNRPSATPESLNEDLDKESLKTALPPTIPNERAYLNNPPVDKKAAGCDQCAAAMINGVFCHEQGCPNAPKKCRHGKMPDVCSVCSDPLEGTDLESSLKKETKQGTCKHCKKDKIINELGADAGVCDSCADSMYRRDYSRESSLKIKAHIRHEDGKWIVYNHDYTKKLGTYGTKEEATKRLRQIEYFKHQGSLRPFSKKAEVLTDPYQSLTNHITEMKSRMSQVQERLQSSPLPKQAGEEDNSKLDLPELFEDLTMGIDLLETKLGGDDIEPELHKSVEDLENLLWTLEEQCGITPKLSSEEKAEPEHKEIVKEVEKESSKKEANPVWPPEEYAKEFFCRKHPNTKLILDELAGGRYCPKCTKDPLPFRHRTDEASLKEAATTTTITTSPAAPAAPAAPTTPQSDDAPSNAPDDASPSCALCGGLTFADYAGYQNHMEYTHASDTMPTAPSQKNLSTTVGSKKKAVDVTVTDETIEEGTGTPPTVTPPTPATPAIQNVQPTDQENLEVPIAKPTSPPAPGQIWVYNPDVMAYVSMPDPSNPGKTI